MTRVSGSQAKPSDVPASQRGSHLRGSILLLLVSLLVCAGLAELAARAFWYFRFDVPFTKPGRVLYAFYPELARIARNNPSRGDGYYNVLLLGSSTLSTSYGEVPQALRERLTAEGRRNVRVFNLAAPAQTSRDDRLAYAAVGPARFDLVVFYEGINEARANNAPPTIFRDDYGHYSWYEVVNALAPYHGSASVALPYTLHYVALRVRQILLKDRYVPSEAPREDWLRYGRDHKSVTSFKHNLEAILTLASERRDPVLLMTFATYLPANYSRDAFEKGQLDYDLHLIPIELWGRPEDVLETVALENEVVRSEAARHAGTLFADQAKLMPKSGRYFNDPCHFTVAGSSQFVENLLPVLPPAVTSP